MATASSSASGDRDLSPADVDPAHLRSIRRTGLSIGVATGLYGISYGALATAAGLDVWQAMVLSAVMFTGGSQFAFVGRSEEHTSELQSRGHLVCRLVLEKKKIQTLQPVI